jgi:hypothetical protein
MNKPKSIFLRGAAAVAVVTAVLAPRTSTAQAPGDEQAVLRLVADIAAQHAKIIENQQAIDRKMAAIEENLRVAKIYVSRGGGPRK